MGVTSALNRTAPLALFLLWWRWSSSSGLSEENSAAGKLEPVPVGVQTVTRSLKSQTYTCNESDTQSVAAVQAQDIMTEVQSQIQTNPNSCTPSHILPNSKCGHLAKLVGRKALTYCNLNGLAVTALLDTGAQVSMIEVTETGNSNTWQILLLTHSVRFFMMERSRKSVQSMVTWFHLMVGYP